MLCIDFKKKLKTKKQKLWTTYLQITTLPGDHQQSTQWDGVKININYSSVYSHIK